MKEESIVSMIEKEANEYAEKISFRIPYDGSNDFYDTKVFEDCNAAYIAGRSKGIESEKAKDERIAYLEERVTLLKLTIEQLKSFPKDDSPF